MSRSESLSFNTGNEEHSVVDLTSNKYAGTHLSFQSKCVADGGLNNVH